MWGGGGIREKAVFFGNKTLDQRFGANLKKKFFLLNFAANLLFFIMFFQLLAQKMLKMTISTSVWGVQHPNAGRNIQQTYKTKQPRSNIPNSVRSTYSGDLNSELVQYLNG